MNLPINDGRNLAVGLLDPASGQWYDPAADALSAFDAARHLRPVKPVSVVPAAAATGAPALPPSLWSNLKSVDVGAALLARPNLVPVFFVADSNGNPTSIADVWPNPYPAGPGVYAGGWAR